MRRTSYSRFLNLLFLACMPLFAGILVWFAYSFTYTFEPADPIIPFLAMGCAGFFLRDAVAKFDALYYQD